MEFFIDILDLLDPDIVFGFTGMTGAGEKTKEYLEQLLRYRVYLKLAISVILLGLTIFKFTKYGAIVERNLKVAMGIKLTKVILLVVIVVIDIMQVVDKEKESFNK